MKSIAFFTVDEAYVDYLRTVEPRLFGNARPGQGHSRKYLGIIFQVKGMNYFAPLSSFKSKHRKMKNSLDFIKIGEYAVVNLNCMFPAPDAVVSRVDFSQEKDGRYRSLLLAEYRIVKRSQEKIRKNAENLYRHKVEFGNSTKLAARCNDFVALEKASSTYLA
ncbi:type III toxin-antitoxin system ToxN/AbiQ family toxin [Adlercreutzia sp. R25]|uniref:Type III toxin-antitoxin system ToxN/AbiQ family toxin n=1 Tax=Adlercreutzia shanghongiae TaxID=3111773 RepID=A0ABU6J0S2_9ACTN|nr:MULTISPECIES: type III toxin-antitoxin system ToxN/AbiQ family toxin [unclassified Adlercreutzia]MEC4273404.1 type III toxin-antitoxin system ToxN/AbiQ family toxin [Adlercreutzia sp. R25]MEC4295558.1 type III toxin-antitoxin system ToxN/AbiQ family toxin [Adlercreutzia sp. R22]